MLYINPSCVCQIASTLLCRPNRWEKSPRRLSCCWTGPVNGSLCLPMIKFQDEPWETGRYDTALLGFFLIFLPLLFFFLLFLLFFLFFVLFSLCSPGSTHCHVKTTLAADRGSRETASQKICLAYTSKSPRGHTAPITGRISSAAKEDMGNPAARKKTRKENKDRMVKVYPLIAKNPPHPYHTGILQHRKMHPCTRP